MPTKKKICIKVYLNAENFPRYASIAERMGKRRGGLLLFVQKPHGLAGEQLANTDGLGRAMKAGLDYWEATESERMKKQADALAKLRQAEQEAELAGVKPKG